MSNLNFSSFYRRFTYFGFSPRFTPPSPPRFFFHVRLLLASVKFDSPRVCVSFDSSLFCDRCSPFFSPLFHSPFCFFDGSTPSALLICAGYSILDFPTPPFSRNAPFSSQGRWSCGS